MRQFVLLTLLLVSCARLRGPQSVTAMVERHGDDAYDVMKGMSVAELSKKDKQGYTPFYWSIYHEAKKIRNLLVEKIPRRQLLKEPIHKDLISVCAEAPHCSANSIQVLAALGFKHDKKSLPATILNYENCSVSKFDVLSELGASRRYRDKDRGNLLHQIIDRGIQGRPIAPRACLIHAITKLRRLAPVLAKEKNRAGLTPLRYAESMLHDSDKWGSNIVKADVEVLVHALK